MLSTFTGSCVAVAGTAVNARFFSSDALADVLSVVSRSKVLQEDRMIRAYRFDVIERRGTRLRRAETDRSKGPPEP